MFCKSIDKEINFHNNDSTKNQLSDILSRLNSNETVCNNKELNILVSELNTLKYNELNERKEEILYIFFNKITRNDYDRSLITEGSDLEKILDYKLFSSRFERDEIDQVTGKKINGTLLEAKFALKLGVIPKQIIPNTNLAYFILSRSGNSLGIYKPAVKRYDDNYGASKIAEAHLAEVATYIFDRELGLGVVPYTSIFQCSFSSITENQGSFQFYVENSTLLFDELKEGDFLWTSDFKKLQETLNNSLVNNLKLKKLKKLALIGMLTGNNDQHFKNILCNQIKERCILVAIDNGNTFPAYHDKDLSSDIVKPLHWFRWKVLPQAQRPFSSKTSKKIENLDENHFISIMHKHLVDENILISKLSIEDKIKTFKDRIALVKEMTKQGKNISDIANSILILTLEKKHENN